MLMRRVNHFTVAHFDCTEKGNIADLYFPGFCSLTAIHLQFYYGFFAVTVSVGQPKIKDPPTPYPARLNGSAWISAAVSTRCAQSKQHATWKRNVFFTGNGNARRCVGPLQKSDNASVVRTTVETARCGSRS